jgi:hypothetical protein
MFIPDPGAGFFFHPGSQIQDQNSTGSRIPVPGSGTAALGGVGEGWARNQIIRARESLAILNQSILSG